VADLAVARFERHLDLGWRRTSFSDITAATHEPRVGSEPEGGREWDEPETTPATGDGEGTELSEIPSLLADMPGGVEVGTFVHRVLEETDYAAADLEAELGDRVAEATARGGVDVGDPAMVVAGLRAALETPLGPLVGDLALRDLARADRLDELAFELPLLGGDTPAGRLTPGTIAGVLREHAPVGDPMRAYADRLSDPALRRAVRGYLAGAIDLVARVPAPDGGVRLAIMDFKTNWLAPPDEELTAWHHRPAALRAEMDRAHYGLQALLYAVALHRYLRWRTPGYDPDEHIAGVLYLFLRGMAGPDTPRVDGVPCGVWSWRPSGALVMALSDALDREVAA
jgi:exodeoxyribonuclease V beta subunit